MIDMILFKSFVVLVGIFAIVFLAIAATHTLWLPWLLKTLADRNLFITAVKEGTAKAFMKFGEFDHMALSWRGYYLDQDWTVRKDGEGDYAKHPKADHPFDRFLPGGLRWIGLPYGNSVYSYHFQWTSIRQGTLKNAVDEPRGKESIVYQGDLKDILDSRDEDLDYVLLKQDLYGETFQDIEDQDMIPLAFIALLTAQVKNPYHSLFATEQWLEQILNFLRSHIKDYVGQRTFSELTGTLSPEEKQKGNKNLSKIQSDEILEYIAPDGESTIREYILEKWGVEIYHLNLVNFKTAGIRGEAYEKATATEYVEKQRAKGIRAIADAEAYRVTTVAAAITAGGDNAMTVRTLEAFEAMGESGATMILGAGERPVQMLIDSARRDKNAPQPQPKKNS